MDGRSVDAQQMFTAATLMCVVWLAALMLLMQQAQLTRSATHLMSGPTLAFLAPHAPVKAPVE